MQCVEESWGHAFWILLTLCDLWYLLREKGYSNGPSGYECKTTVARAVRPGKNSIQNEILPQRSPFWNTLPIFFIRSFYLNPVRTCQNLAHTHKAQAPVRELRVAHVASPHELPNNIFGPLKLDHRGWKETLTTLAILQWASTILKDMLDWIIWH